MNVFYEEEGSFKAAAVMSESPGSLQVESLYSQEQYDVVLV